MGVLGSGENGVKKFREQGALLNERVYSLIWGAVIKITWGAGSGGQNFEGSEEARDPPCRASFRSRWKLKSRGRDMSSPPVSVDSPLRESTDHGPFEKHIICQCVISVPL